MRNNQKLLNRLFLHMGQGREILTNGHNRDLEIKRVNKYYIGGFRTEREIGEFMPGYR